MWPCLSTIINVKLIRNLFDNLCNQFILWAMIALVQLYSHVNSQSKIAKSIKEITWLDYLLLFPVDPLPGVIGLGITLITTLLING